MIIDPLTSRIVYGTWFETRACLVLNSLLNESVISDVQALRLCSTFEVGVGVHKRLRFLVLLHGFSIRINLWDGVELGTLCSVHA